MASREATLKFNLKRAAGFFRAILRSKRGTVGLAIIVIAVVVALTAPLITPYNPIWSTNLSAKLVPPAWLGYLPGEGGLSQNMVPVSESSLLKGANPLEQFNITVTPSNLAQDVTVQYSAFGPTGSSGSLAIIFQANGLPENSNVTVQIMRKFNYPYSGIPGAMILSGSILTSKIEGFAVSPRLLLEQNWLTFTPLGVASYNVTKFEFGRNATSPDLPAPVTFTEADLTGYSASALALGWQSPLQLPIYEVSEDPVPLHQLFPRAGSYSYGISITETTLTANANQSVVYVGNVELNLQGTSWGLLGTDAEGRDVFTQLAYGTQVSLYVGLTAAFFSTIIGLFVGLVAAYAGGIVDEVLMRFTDALLVLPGLPLMIVLIFALSGGAYNINILILVIGVLGWQGFARMVRSQVLSLKERPYVEAAKAVGAGTPYILWRHILPNVIVLVYVTLALTVPAAIVTEAAFAFIGFIDLAHMSWGRMLTSLESNPGIWWLVIPPGLAIMILSLSFILIGYAIDDILNPRLRARR